MTKKLSVSDPKVVMTDSVRAYDGTVTFAEGDGGWMRDEADAIILEVFHLRNDADGQPRVDADNVKMSIVLSGEAWEMLKRTMLPIVQAEVEADEAEEIKPPVPYDLIDKVRADRDRDQVKVDTIRRIRDTLADVYGDDMTEETKASLVEVDKRLAKTEQLIAIADEVLAMTDKEIARRGGADPLPM